MSSRTTAGNIEQAAATTTERVGQVLRQVHVLSARHGSAEWNCPPTCLMSMGL